VPVLVIRGANSDILSAETVTAMGERHRAMESIEVPDEGHVPQFHRMVISRVIEFVARCEMHVGHTPAAAAQRTV
jgi:pimeloyl-ACP methyl ester carboxylesterase